MFGTLREHDREAVDRTLCSASDFVKKRSVKRTRKTRDWRLKSRRGPVHLVYSRLMRIRLAFPILVALILPAQSFTQSAAPAPGAIPDYSGMYEFLRDGEFVQLTIEDKGNVTGFISRFGDSESDKGVFMNQFFKAGKLDGDKLSFTTEPVHSVWYEFSGAVVRGAGKKPEEEAYYVLQGTLTRFNTDQDKKTTSQARSVELKSFPRDAASN
jgi:hypothetical protein